MSGFRSNVACAYAACCRGKTVVLDDARARRTTSERMDGEMSRFIINDVERLHGSRLGYCSCPW